LVLVTSAACNLASYSNNSPFNCNTSCAITAGSASISAGTITITPAEFLRAGLKNQNEAMFMRVGGA
jgi:hypothetical protein